MEIWIFRKEITDTGSLPIKKIGHKKNRDVLNSSLFSNLTKSILYEKTLKLFKFYTTKIRRILVNAFKRKLKNVNTSFS
jgi:hypothetical protein